MICKTDNFQMIRVASGPNETIIYYCRECGTLKIVDYWDDTKVYQEIVPARSKNRGDT